MRNPLLFLCLFLIGFSSCKNKWEPATMRFSYWYVKDSIPRNPNAADSLLMPFRTELKDKVSKLIILSNNFLSKKQPESALGNLLADVTLEEADSVSGKPCDAAFINYGGIRSTLPAGPITLGNVMEVLPFENFLTIVEVDSQSFREFALYCIKTKGQPISGFTIQYQNDSLLNIVWKKPNVTYPVRIAMSDYTANGGDKCSFFKRQSVKQFFPITLRDLVIRNWTRKHAQNQKLTARDNGSMEQQKP